MANDTIGDPQTLQFDIPQKGNKDWSQVIKDAFKEISTHTHEEGGKGAKIGPDGLSDSLNLVGKTVTLTPLEIEDGEIANDTLTVAKKKTYDLTLTGSAQSLTDLVTSADQAFKLNYKIKDSGGTSVQIGTLTGQAGDYKVDEFVGTDRGATFSYSTNQLQITGTNTDILTYSIEFLE